MKAAWWVIWIPWVAAAQPSTSLLEARLNAREVPPLMALFSDDARVELALDAQRQRIPNEAWVGRGAIDAFLAVHTRGLSTKFSDVSAAGDHASWRLEMKNDYFRSLGLDSVGAHVNAEWLGDRLSKLSIAIEPSSSEALATAVPRANKAAVRHFFDQINQGDLSTLDENLSPTFVQHSSMPVGPGPGGVKRLYAGLKAAFPDLQVTIEDLVAEGDRVVARMTWRGTHKGEYLGVSATGRPVVLTKIDIFRFASGKNVEHWDVVDRLGLLQQLGVVPRYPQWNPSLGYDGIR